MRRKAAVHNLGCKVNAYETEAMQQLLEGAGYEIVPFAPGADVYVINTCSVTNIADRKSRQMLHRAKKMNPEAVVVAAGCYVQTDTEGVQKDPAVDLILGNNRKQNLLEVLEEYYRQQGKKEDVIRINQTREYEPLHIARTAEHVRAYIKVQDGCNQFCAYCIIPYARGRVRSRRLSDVLSEVQALAQKGYREVVLTGIHLSSYGVDFAEDEKEDLLSLIRAVHAVEGVKRIRLGSLEPRIVTETFASAIAALPKICPHFHLSLQSGCDETLVRMNRRYTAREFREICDRLRRNFEDPALTTDVIVGFPGETEEEFAASYAFVDDIHFYETHVFPYSRRKGTKADRMEGQVSDSVKKERSERLLLLTQDRKHAYEERHLGKALEVLFEEEKVLDGVPYLLGHSREYIPVAVPAEEGDAVNEIRTVIPEGFCEGILTARETLSF